LPLFEEGKMLHEITPTNDQEKLLIHKIRNLSPDKIAEVENFVDFLNQKNRERRLIHASNKLAEDAFRKIWDNSEDDAYDNL
jgi:hypothetical protein